MKRNETDYEKNVTTKSKRRCALCYGLNSDLLVKRGQIAHLDQNPENNREDNLAYLCLEHHDNYDSRASQARGIGIREAKHHRDELYRVIEEDKHIQHEMSEIGRAHV